jgi:hypothetical protein
MRTLTAVGLAAAVLAACGGEPPCDNLRGRTYLRQARELSGGTCGPVGDSLEVAPETTGHGEGVPPGCIALGDIPASGTCAWGEARQCINDDGSITTARITYRLNDDDETWSGLADVTIKDRGQTVCHSAYELTITPQ